MCEFGGGGVTFLKKFPEFEQGSSGELGVADQELRAEMKGESLGCVENWRYFRLDDTGWWYRGKYRLQQWKTGKEESDRGSERFVSGRLRTNFQANDERSAHHL